MTIPMGSGDVSGSGRPAVDTADPPDSTRVPQRRDPAAADHSSATSRAPKGSRAGRRDSSDEDSTYDAVTAPVPLSQWSDHELDDEGETPRDRQATSAPVRAPSVVRRNQDRAITKGAKATKIAASGLLALSVLVIGFLAFVFVLSALPEQRAQTGLQRRFATILTHGQAAIGGSIPRGTPVARLDIPRLGIHQVVVEGTSAHQLRGGAGHVIISPLPGQPGNAIIAAHRLAWGAPFGELSRLHRGDAINVVTGQGRVTYKVTALRQVGADDVRPLQATTGNRLTLVTAASLDASRRLIVQSELVGNAQPAPPGRPSVLSASDGGLVGEHGVLPALGWWLQVLLLVAVATVVLYHRFPLWSSYLISTPVVLVAMWLVFENLARLIPATL